jgi:asparagine synthase (glutamine-hydrolysing)
LEHLRRWVIDLSLAVNQPFDDGQEDIHAVVNGDLYDYKHYHARLAEDYNFQRNSDCEIVIAQYRSMEFSS